LTSQSTKAYRDRWRNAPDIYVPAVTVFTKWRVAVPVGLLVVAGGVGAGLYFGLSADGGEEQAPAPAPQIVIERQQPEAAQDLGFPAFATKNTTRVAGSDPTADAAGIALAVYPSVGGVEGPAAVTLVDAGDWPGGIAASVLAGPPVRAPILLSGPDSVPTLTDDALRALAPQGSGLTDDKQIFRIGDVATPQGARTLDVKGSNPAEVAAAVDGVRQKLTGTDPDGILLASSEKAPYAMPAAAWAARSGDPVLFLRKDSAPQPTLDALKRHRGVPVFVLGPESVISDKALQQVRAVAPDATRVGADDPVSNAIAFARYVNGSFGWNINDPGHGFVIVSAARPADAAAAAPLSASGTWGPLLVTDDPARVPKALQGYLLDVKPGYQDDPTRAVYNHVWMIGDEQAISVPFQAQVDDLAELAPIGSGKGAGPAGHASRTPETEK
jgi:hypothetical protein